MDIYLNPNSNLLSVLCLLFKNKYCYFAPLFLINTLLVCWFISYQYFACLLVYFLSILCLSVGLFLINTLIVCWFISYQYFACLLVYFLLILCLSVNLLVSKKRQKGRTDPSKICLKNLT